jgi:hypothetical protein
MRTVHEPRYLRSSLVDPIAKNSPKSDNKTESDSPRTRRTSWVENARQLMGRSNMKKTWMVIVCALMLVAAALAAAPRFVSVSGAGMGIDADQNTADQAADSQAQNNLQNACAAGTLTKTQKIFDQCSQAGDHYVCNVNYTGICQF